MGGPGSSPPLGNQNAKKGKRWRDALWKALARYSSDDVKSGEALDKVAEKGVICALAGDKDAWNEIGNRLDGKPAQAIIGGEGDDPPLVIRGIVELVRPTE